MREAAGEASASAIVGGMVAFIQRTTEAQRGAQKWPAAA